MAATKFWSSMVNPIRQAFMPAPVCIVAGCIASPVAPTAATAPARLRKPMLARWLTRVTASPYFVIRSAGLSIPSTVVSAVVSVLALLDPEGAHMNVPQLADTLPLGNRQ